MATSRRSNDTTDAAGDESAADVTTMEGLKADIGDPTPEDLGKPVSMTGPGGTKLTVPKRSVERLKGMGYK